MSLNKAGKNKLGDFWGGFVAGLGCFDFRNVEHEILIDSKGSLSWLFMAYYYHYYYYYYLLLILLLLLLLLL